MDAIFRKNVSCTSVALALLLVLSAADFVSGPYLSLSLFYLLIVAFVAWTTRSSRIAVVFAAVCAAVWLVAERLTAGSPSIGILVWNAATRLLILVTIAWLIARLRAALEAEKSLSRTDFLTGLLNSRAFSEVAAGELLRSRRYDHPLTLAYVDLDNFKHVNDRLGHAQGDVLLREVSRLVVTQLRETDTVARVGGDEFLLLLPETSKDEARHVMEKLRASLEDAVAVLGVDVSFSIGVAVYPDVGHDVQSLVRCADTAMYEAKAAGKNCVRFSRAAQHERTVMSIKRM